MKIGILTYHRAHNYGAFMQSYALADFLSKNVDCSVEIIDYDMKKAFNTYKLRLTHHLKTCYWRIRMDGIFKNALKLLPLSKSTLITDSLEEFNSYINNRYDIIIVGSDEIWRIDNFRGFPNPYWLINTKCTHKLSYAASSRVMLSETFGENKQKMISALTEFEYVGVRDTLTYKEICKLTDPSKVELNCDPTFLLDEMPVKEKDRKILARYGLDKNKKWIGIMMESSDIVNKLKEYYGDNVEIISFYDRNKGTKFAYLSPFEWAKAISELDFFITRYFHGICFSIIGKTPFYAIENRAANSNMSKVYELLDEELKERIVLAYDLNYEKLLNYSDSALNMDNDSKKRWENICENKIKKEKIKSQNFLRIIKFLCK